MKQIRLKLSIALSIFILSAIQLNAQVTIGAPDAPDPGAVLELKSADKGFLLPRVELLSTESPSPLPRHVAGMEVYNTAIGTEVYPGKYYNDGNRWFRVGDATTEPWYSAVTGSSATLNTENIFQSAAVGIGDSNIDPNAQLDVASSSKGVLIPRLTSDQRSNIPNPVDGLMIYNITTHCFNYFDTNAGKWLSLCGSMDPARFYLLSCDSPVGPQGSYRQGKPLTSSETYTVVLGVSESGTYQILAKTGNGYSYSKSGTFTEPGQYTVVLDGQGTPANAANPGNAILLSFNGADITPECSLPLILVTPSATQVVMTCGSAVVNGQYLKGESVGLNNYIDIPVTSVPSPGTLLIETNGSQNGLKFSSGSITVDASTTSIRLYAQGIPQATGTFSYTFNIPDGSNTPCSFNVTTTSLLGSFKFPAKNCLALLTESPGAADGEYWIQKSSSEPTVAVKTFCDMTHGGYTMLWSYSEKTSYDIYGGGSNMGYGTEMQLSSNKPNNEVYAEAGTMIYENYRLTSPTMRSAATSTLAPYRVRIAYKPKDMNDAWGNNNYFEVMPQNTLYGLTTSTGSGCEEREYPTTGKLFGLDYKTTTANNSISYNGYTGGNWNCYYVGTGGYGTHWDMFFDSRPATTGIFPKEDGSTVNYNFNPNWFNNVFGYWAETEINHQFGKCGGAAGDDYNFTITTCGTDANRVPHSFNGGQGRYLQWFVK